MAAGCLCLAQAFVGCLNPLTDDQPSARPVDAIDVSPGSPPANDPSPNAPTTVAPGDNYGGGQNSPSEGASSGAADAGVEQLDAGADSGSLESSP